MSNYFNELATSMAKLGRQYDLSHVFWDLLTIGVCSFHRINIQSALQEKDQANEHVYLETIKSYEEKDLDIFAKALGVLQLNVLDNPYSDILGDFFMEHITKGQNGQYFTPSPICDMVAEINIPKDI